VAQAVHAASTRAHRPLVAVDCASMPENLFESELFGHERGAFTGANTARGGLVEAASGGTLFLDEVGDIPLHMQVKLLRLLETGTYRRVGSTELRHADIRVVSATHRDLHQMVANGTFREDLYYRLSTFPINLPPLRERKDDIALLCSALLERFDAKRHLKLADDALTLLQAQYFSGNVRELRNVLERASLLCDGETLEREHLQQAISTTDRTTSNDQHVLNMATSRPVIRNQDRSPLLSLKGAQQEALAQLVAHHQGSKAELAKKLGISERSLYRKLKTLR